VGHKHACNAMLLGSLIREVKSRQISLSTDPPDSTVSIAQLICNLREIKVVALCDSINQPMNNYYQSYNQRFLQQNDPAHGIIKMIDEKLKEIEARLCELEVEHING
jgi:hypothetical protein